MKKGHTKNELGHKTIDGRNPFLSYSEYEIPIKGNKKNLKPKAVACENPLVDNREYVQPIIASATRNANSKKNLKAKMHTTNGHPKTYVVEKSNESENTSNTSGGRKKKRRRGKGNSFPNILRNQTNPEQEQRHKRPEQTKSLSNTSTIWGIDNLPTITSKPSDTGKFVKSVGTLSLDAAGSFNWNATPQDLARVMSHEATEEPEYEDSDEEVPTKKKKLTAAEKRAKALEEEKHLKRIEKNLLEADENPQSPDHFERLLLGSPNSAELWIKYIGFHAVNADIEKARVIARRGIKRIDPKFVSEKLDLWVAFLNIEYNFSPPEVFNETFSEAVKCNDDYAINSHVLQLYADSKNVTEVDQLTNVMVKKYKHKLENWLQCQNALMQVGLVEKARNLLQKALSILTKKEHICLISRFALLENKYSFTEQAHALFENLITSFPQRIDILSVYVDMLVKSNLKDLARSVLERAASNSLPARKMKSIYVKWLAFEEQHGNQISMAKVEIAARKYVSDKLGKFNLKKEDETEGKLNVPAKIEQKDDFINEEDEQKPDVPTNEQSDNSIEEDNEEENDEEEPSSEDGSD